MDAPVSLELLRQIVLGVLVNTIVALPMWVLVRRCLIGGLPEDPAGGAAAPTPPAG